MGAAGSDAVVGVVSLYAAGRNAFTDDHGRLVQMIAPHVAQALSKAERSHLDELAQAKAPRDLRLVASR